MIHSLYKSYFIFLGVALQICSDTAHAELREGPACDLPAVPAAGPPPAKCNGIRYAMVSITVPKLGTGVSVNTPDPKCGEKLNTPSVAAQAAGAFATAYSGSPTVGLIVASLSDQVAQGLVPNNKLFHQHTDRANCAAIVAVIPAVATIVGQRLVADSLAAGPAQCEPGTDCPKGFSRFTYTPVLNKRKTIQYVSVDYMNWASYDQTGRLIIFYQMPRNSKPPIPKM